MKVVVAKHAGFCKGVKSAFDKALELVEKYGKFIRSENSCTTNSSRNIYKIRARFALT